MSGSVRYPIPRAVEAMALRSHHVVEASAGTGKTFAIEHRAVDLILRAGATIDQVLLVTFTDKATAELRRRVRQLLIKVRDAREDLAPAGEPAWEVGGEARRRLSAAIAGFDRAPIFTIHGFCHRLLGESALATRRPLEQTQVAAETAFATAYKAVLRDTLAVEPDCERLLRAYLSVSPSRSVDTLHKLLYDCAQRGGRVVPELDASELCAAFRQVAVETSDEAAMARAFAGTPARWVSSRAARLGELAEIAQAFGRDGDLPAALAVMERRKVDLVKIAGDLGPGQGLRDSIARLSAAIVPLAAAVAGRFLPLVLERVGEVKSRRGLFDYQDMLALTWKALSEPGGERLARRLRDRYPFALIDEFQDTDPLQWKIFRAIYMAEPGGYLTVVGDPKQAIYGFRGADVQTYLAAAREVSERGGQETRLEVNFRSTAPMVAACNRMFASETGEPFFSDGIRGGSVAAGAGVIAVDASGNEVPPLHLFRIQGAEPWRAEDIRRLIGNRIAAEIRGMLTDPGRSLRVGRAGALRPVRAENIFVLTRSVSEAEEIASRLRGAGVPCALFKQEGLFQRHEALDVRDVLAAIAEPSSHAARMRAWRTRFFALGLDALAHVQTADQADPMIARLYEWKALADRMAYEELFARILADSRLVERELLLEPSERTLTNIYHLFELLLESTFETRREIHELVQLLSHWIDDTSGWDGGDRNLMHLESDRSAVQVMTIHKAKGLEADVVFVYGGLGASNGDDVRVLHRGGERLLAVGPRAGGADAEAEARSEDERLLYVALTRAVARLYLTAVDPDAFEVKGAYRAVAERLGDGRAWSDLATVEDVTAGVGRGFGRRVVGEDLAGWQARPRTGDSGGQDVFAIRQARRGFAVTSYTRMKTSYSGRASASATREGRVADATRDALGPIEAIDFMAEPQPAVELGEDELTGGRESGIFLHDVLEHVPLAIEDDLESWRRRPEVEAVFSRAMRRHGRDARQRAASEALVYRALTSPLEIAGTRIDRIASAERAVREMEFLYPVGDHAFVKGFIDLVFEWRGRTYVVDWKSDVLADYSPAALARHVAEHYEIQGKLYSIALSRLLAARNPAEHDQRFGGIVYSFLRGGSCHSERPDHAEIARREAELFGMEIR